MPTIREIYFDSLNKKKDHVSESDIRDLLIIENRLKSYTDLTIHFDDEMKNEEDFKNLFARLQNGEMIQYITNQASFLGDKYYVNESVLIPRQETEQLVSLTADFIKYNFDKHITIADVCTGSGVIAISLAREFKGAKVFATDISEAAIDVAKKNNATFNVNIEFLTGNLIDPLLEKNVKLDVLVCNPPYIEKEEEIDPRTWKYEPHLALLAKPATKYYEIIINKINNIMNEHFLIAFEIGEDMEESLTKVLQENGLDGCYRFEKDIYGKLRFLFIMK